MKIVLSTDNLHKLAEIQAILAPCGIELVSKKQAGCFFEVEETGATFAENARLKAEAVCRETGLPTLADDSGLCVDALDGAPGLYSARFTGSHDDSDAAKVAYLLKKLQGVTERSAHFTCAVCCLFPDGREIAVEGICPGRIAESPAGDGGFGYDPVFMPEGYGQTMAQLGTDMKNRISHRARAFRAFINEWEKTEK